jgi:hypothetical protein
MFDFGVSGQFVRLRLPHKLAVDANQAPGLQLLAYSPELLARILGVAIEHALAIKLLTPSAELHDNGPGWQFEVFRCRLPAAGRAGYVTGLPQPSTLRSC